MPSANVDNTASIETLVPPPDMELTPADFGSSAITGVVGLASLIQNYIGTVLAALGLTDSLYSNNPVVAVPGTGMTINVGGSGQRMFCQGLPLDNCAVDTLTVAAADATHPRIDLLAVKAVRVTGPSTVTRNVRSISATPNPNPISGTLVAGVCAINLTSYGYTATPAPSGLTPIGDTSTGTLRVRSISTEWLVIDSTDSADTRTFNLQLAGVGSGITSTTIATYENQPSWQIVTGTPATTPVAPACPSGYEAFAQILVPAGATSLTGGDITPLFTQIPDVLSGFIESVVDGVGISISGSPVNPTIGLSHGDYLDQGSGAQSKSGPLTLAELIAPFLTLTAANGAPIIGNDAGTIAGINFVVPYQTTYGFRFLVLDVHGVPQQVLQIDNNGGIHAGSFNGSGAGLNSIPLSALDSFPVVTIDGETGIITATQVNPGEWALAFVHGDYADIANAQTILGQKTFAARPIASGLVVHTDGTITGISGTATITLPNDGLSYKIKATWSATGAYRTTPDIPSVASSGTAPTGFAHYPGAGYDSGTLTAFALCAAVGAGQTLTFTLAALSGSSLGAGFWTCDAVAQ